MNRNKNNRIPPERSRPIKAPTSKSKLKLKHTRTSSLKRANNIENQQPTGMSKIANSIENPYVATRKKENKANEAKDVFNPYKYV